MKSEDVCGIEGKLGTEYLPDTNILVFNPFAIYILSGNEIPKEDLKNSYLESLARREMEYDRAPNDVYIYEVVEKELSPYLESLYIQGGVTFLKYYYTEKDEIYGYVGTLPGTLTAIDGSTQIVVERIQDSSRRLTIQSLYDNQDIDILTTKEIFLALCNHLVSTPPECALNSISSTL